MIITSDIYALADKVIEAAKSKGVTLATAESCTGGLIGGALTAIPGSSSVYLGGVISYANSVKIDVLGVNPNDIETDGAVSKSVATAMATGAIKCVKADISVSVTGVAGPDGGTPDKPVGTVWIGTAVKRKNLETICDAALQQFGDTSREEVRRDTIIAALNALNELIAKA